MTKNRNTIKRELGRVICFDLNNKYHKEFIFLIFIKVKSLDNYRFVISLSCPPCATLIATTTMAFSDIFVLLSNTITPSPKPLGTEFTSRGMFVHT